MNAMRGEERTHRAAHPAPLTPDSGRWKKNPFPLIIEKGLAGKAPHAAPGFQRRAPRTQISKISAFSTIRAIL